MGRQGTGTTAAVVVVILVAIMVIVGTLVFFSLHLMLARTLLIGLVSIAGRGAAVSADKVLRGALPRCTAPR
jgi:hypothetical protein